MILPRIFLWYIAGHRCQLRPLGQRRLPIVSQNITTSRRAIQTYRGLRRLPKECGPPMWVSSMLCPSNRKSFRSINSPVNKSCLSSSTRTHCITWMIGASSATKDMKLRRHRNYVAQSPFCSCLKVVKMICDWLISERDEKNCCAVCEGSEILDDSWCAGRLKKDKVWRIEVFLLFWKCRIIWQIWHRMLLKCI